MRSVPAKEQPAPEDRDLGCISWHAKHSSTRTPACPVTTWQDQIPSRICQHARHGGTVRTPAEMKRQEHLPFASGQPVSVLWRIGKPAETVGIMQLVSTIHFLISGIMRCLPFTMTQPARHSGLRFMPVQHTNTLAQNDNTKRLSHTWVRNLPALSAQGHKMYNKTKNFTNASQKCAGILGTVGTQLKLPKTAKAFANTSQKSAGTLGTVGTQRKPAFANMSQKSDSAIRTVARL